MSVDCTPKSPDVREKLHNLRQLGLHFIWVNLLILHQVVTIVGEELGAGHLVAHRLSFGGHQRLVDEHFISLQN